MRATTSKLIAIVLLAGALRVLTLVVVQGAHVSWQYEYEEIAYNLADHGEYTYSFYGLGETLPTSFQPPLYPLFFAGMLKLGGGGLQALVPVQIVLALFSVYLVFQLALAVGLSPAAGLLAALFMAGYPPLVLYAVMPSPVTIETFFLLAGTYFTLRTLAPHSLGWALAAGASLALAGLTRSPWLLVIPISMLWTAWQTESRSWKRLQTPLLLGLAALLVLLPWARHNARVQGTWSLNGTNGGLNFWIGNNPQATGEYIFPTQIDRQLVMQTAEWPERQRDRFFYQQGLDYIRAHPAAALQLDLKKLGYFVFYRPSIGSNYQSVDLEVEIAQKLFVVSWLLILPLGLAGLWVARQHRPFLLLLAIILCQAVVTMLYFAGTRFRTPMEPFFMLWAAGFLVWVHQAWRARRDARNDDA